MRCGDSRAGSGESDARTQCRSPEELATVVLGSVGHLRIFRWSNRNESREAPDLRLHFGVRGEVLHEDYLRALMLIALRGSEWRSARGWAAGADPERPDHGAIDRSGRRGFQ